MNQNNIVDFKPRQENRKPLVGEDGWQLIQTNEENEATSRIVEYQSYKVKWDGEIEVMAMQYVANLYDLGPESVEFDAACELFVSGCDWNRIEEGTRTNLYAYMLEPENRLRLNRLHQQYAALLIIYDEKKFLETWH